MDHSTMDWCAVSTNRMIGNGMQRYQAAGDDSINTLTALAVDELLLNGNLENARLLFQVRLQGLDSSHERRR